MLKHVVLAFLAVLPVYIGAQSFSGTIYDKDTRNPIPHATVYLVDFEIGTVSDSLGFFQFTSPLPAQVKIRISYPLYESFQAIVPVQKNAMFYLEENHLELDEIVVSNARGDLHKNNVNPVEVRKIDELKAIPSTNLGELLATIPGVYQSSTGPGISKPVIRGMQGMRVVTYLNGLRIENQQWGGDHGMGINDLGISSVEVIKGPASLQFGSDALGGVLYFQDDAYARQNTQEIELRSQFESNTLGHNNRLEYKIAKNRLRFNLSGLYANHADYRLPDGTFAGNSRFAEQDLKSALGFHFKNWVTHIRYTYVNNRTGIPGHSHDSIIDFADFRYKGQSREQTIPAQLIRNHYLSLESKYFFKRGEINLLAGETVNQLTELEDKLTIPAIHMGLQNSLYQLRYIHNFTEKLSLISGFQGMYQRTRNYSDATEFLVPNGNTIDNGVYSIAYLSYKKWNFQAGLRFDNRLLESLENYKENPPIRKDFSQLSFSAGGVRNSEKTTVRLNVSNGFRTPHFTELLSNGEHHGTLRYEIGNRDLKSENAAQMDFSFEYHNEHLAFTINPFYSLFQNYIYINPIDSVAEGLPVFQYEQMKQAQIAGVDLGFHYHPHFAHFLHLESSFSTLSMQGAAGQNLPLTPQSRINSFVKISLKMKGRLKIEQLVLQHSYYFRQDRVVSYETASKAYNLLHFALNLKWSGKYPLWFDLGFKNFTNTNYINHLSRLKNIQLPSPGFNLYCSLKFRLESQLNKSK
ncbi:MAG: TonB-dependent receptor [Crocinitomicaceae bacterium]|jgi:iron complex outermembrane receptor protein|nr:TonB-dependent receptor [Crocinitomicaceae bacterium]